MLSLRNYLYFIKFTIACSTLQIKIECFSFFLHFDIQHIHSNYALLSIMLYFQAVKIPTNICTYPLAGGVIIENNTFFVSPFLFDIYFCRRNDKRNFKCIHDSHDFWLKSNVKHLVRLCKYGREMFKKKPCDKTFTICQLVDICSTR